MGWNDLDLYDMRVSQFAIVKNINEMLGISSSLDDDVKVERSSIEKCIPYFEKEKLAIYTSFGFKDEMKEGSIFNFKNSIALIKKIYANWTGGELKTGGKNHKNIALFYIYKKMQFSKKIFSNKFIGNMESFWRYQLVL